MTLTNRDKKVLLLLVVVAMLAGYWYFVYAPKQQQISDLGDKVAAKQRELQTAEQQLTQSSNARATYASDYTTVVRLGEAVPADDAIPSLLVQLDALAGKSVDFTQVGVNQYPDRLLAPSQGSGASQGTAGQAAAQPASSQSGASPSGGAAAKTTSQSKSQGSLGIEPVPVRMEFQGNFFRLSGLVAAIDRLVSERGGRISVSGRLAFIQGFDVKQGKRGFPQVAVSVGALVFALPKDQSVTGDATPQGPQQTGAQPVSSKHGGSASGPTPSATATPIKP